MAGLDRLIDSATGDYLDDGAGGTKTTRSAITKLHHQLKTPLGSWFGDPLAGSRLHELERSKNSVRSPRVIEDMVRECCLPLQEESAIGEVTFRAERGIDAVEWEANAKDLQTGEDLDLSDLLPVNV